MAANSASHTRSGAGVFSRSVRYSVKNPDVSPPMVRPRKVTAALSSTRTPMRSSSARSSSFIWRSWLPNEQKTGSFAAIAPRNVRASSRLPRVSNMSPGMSSASGFSLRISSGSPGAGLACISATTAKRSGAGSPRTTE